jgi:hypothetical protein
MDCDAARLLILFLRRQRRELDPAEAQALDNHLAECPECQARADTDARLDEHLGRTMRSVSVPEGARSRLVARLRATDRWSMARSRAAAVAVAAALFLAAWVGVRSGERERVDLHGAWVAANEQYRSQPDRVQAWFHDTYRICTVAPSGFNYDCLVFYDLADFQGKRVPLLLFTRGEANARVYIVAQTQFDLSDAVDQPGYNVELRREPGQEHVAYVVVYTAERLDTFLKPAETRLTSAAEESATGAQ